MSRSINYDKLVPGMVIGTTSMSPFAITTRITTAGIQNAFNPNIATHIALVCREHGLFYLMEMAYPKIRQSDVNKYGFNPAGNHIVFAALPFPADDYITSENANDFLLQSHAIGIKYDIKELFEFWGFDVYDDRKKLICSDLLRNMLKKLKISYPPTWSQKVSPWDEQQFFKRENKHVTIF